MFKFIACAAAAVVFISLAACSSVPPLATEPGHGPRVRDIVNHVNCELLSIELANPYAKGQPSSAAPKVPIDPRILEREAFDPELIKLIPNLQKYHFVASALLTMDTSDSEGLYPSTSFIYPFTTGFSRAIGLGGQLNGSQERNFTSGYSIDLANVGDGCRPDLLASPEVGIAGNLGLGDIIADGLTGLQAAEKVNIYSSGGPTQPAFDAPLRTMKIHIDCADTGCQGKGPVDLYLTGNVNFSPSGDNRTPGSISFSGAAFTEKQGRKAGSEVYLVNLTGSTFDIGSKDRPAKRFTLSGTMTGETSTPEGLSLVSLLGRNPNISLTGTLDLNSSNEITGLSKVTGFLTASEEKQKSHFNISGGPNGKPAASNLDKAKSVLSSDQLVMYSLPLSPALSSGGSSGASGALATKTTGGASSSSSTQFGSLVNFSITFGVNGGPNWTLSTFKGPGGGTGPGSQLLSATRTHTASLQITFVAACYDDANVQHYRTFWDTIPKCNGTQVASAAAAGQAVNYLLANGRPRNF